MAIKDEVLGTKIEPQTPVLPEATPMTQDQLKAKISTGDFTASEARQYNQMTGSNTGARDVALTSQDAMRNQDFQTAVTPQEVGMMQDAGIKQVNSDRITLDATAPQSPTQTPVTPVTPTPTKVETPSVKIESIEQFKQKGANLPNLEQFIEDRYGGTATQEDGGVTSVINGEKFKWTIDNAGNPNKVSLGKVQQDMSAMDNADTLYTSLLAGQVIPETLKTSNNYVKAQNRFNQYNQFKNLNQSQYQQLLAQGKLIPGTQSYNDLMNDPVAKSNIIKAQNLNATNQNQKAEEKIASTENNQSDVILSNNPTVAQALEDGSLSAQEYQSLTNTPDITEKSKNVSKLKEEYIKLKSDYDAVEDEVLEEYKGKGKSGSYLRAKIQARRSSLFKELSLSEQLYSSAMGELTTMKNDATALLNTNLQLYKEQQSRQQQLADLQDQRTYAEQQAEKELQQKYDFTYGDLDSTDPRVQNIAIEKAVQSMYEKYPLPGLESQSIKVQKIKDRIAQGMSGTQAIQEVENEIRNSNRYKQYLASEQAKISPQETQDWAKLSDGTLYNQRTGETRSVSDITEGGDEFFDKYSFIKKSEGFRDQAYDDATGKTLAPGEVPQGTATIGYGFTSLGGKPVKAGDTMTREQADGAMVQIADKYTTFKNKIKVPLSNQQEGALISLEYNLGPGWKEYPAGKKIIEAINKGDFKTASNILATSGMGTTNAKTGEVMQGLVNRRKKEAELLLQGGSDKSIGQYTELVKGFVNGVGELQDLTATEKGKVLPELQAYIKTLETDDKDRNRIIKSTLNKKNPSDTTLNKIQDMQTVKFQLDGLEKRLSEQSTGPILGKIKKLNPYDTEAQVAIAQLAGLTPKVARGIFGEVGVLTDADIENYQKALPNLTSTEEKNKLVIDFMRKLLSEGYKNAIVTQSKGGVNMSEFLSDYDEIKNNLNNTGTPTGNAYTSNSGKTYNLDDYR